MRSDLILFARDIGPKDPVLSQKELKRIKLPLKCSSKMSSEHLSDSYLVLHLFIDFLIYKNLKL